MKSPFCSGKSSRERRGDALLREPGDHPADRVPSRRRIEIGQANHDIGRTTYRIDKTHHWAGYH